MYFLRCFLCWLWDHADDIFSNYRSILVEEKNPDPKILIFRAEILISKFQTQKNTAPSLVPSMQLINVTCVHLIWNAK